MASSPNGMNEIPATVSKAFEDINSVVSSYISAVTKSSAALWQGIEEITRSVSGFSQESLARAASAYTTMASTKSPKEVIETQTDFVKDSFDSAIAGSNKVSEISVRVAQDAMAPITQHANETIGNAMKKAKTPQ